MLRIKDGERKYQIQETVDDDDDYKCRQKKRLNRIGVGINFGDCCQIVFYLTIRLSRSMRLTRVTVLDVLFFNS